MAEKTLKTRIQLKNETAENWEKAINFTPKQGEMIVYNYDIPRLKIGDGNANVNSLSFLDENFVFKTTTINSKPLSSNITLTKADLGLGNVGNFKAVSTIANQGLTSSEKSAARENIGAGTSSFSGNYNDLTNKPVIPNYSVATSTSNGLMSSSDKSKLDGIAAGANKYTHPTYTAKSSGLYKVTVDATGHVSATVAVAKADITALGIPAQDTTYTNATTSKAGLMSSTDKAKLDGIAAGANKTVVDSSLSSTSLNPVQNKVLYASLAAKAPVNHTHDGYLECYTMKDIPNSSDLNTYDIPGTYTSRLKANSSTMINGPTKESGYLLYVVSSYAQEQIPSNSVQIAIDGSFGNIYTRRKISTSWSAWKTIMTTSDFTLSKLGITATAAELNYCDGVTSNIQTQLNGKAATSHTHSGYAASTHTHTATQVTGLSASRALVSNSSGQVAVAAVTSTELGYLDGVKSNIQNQLNAKVGFTIVASVTDP